MENKFTINNKDYFFARYPKTVQRSLRAWNAADEYILNYFDELQSKNAPIAIYNDRFGFLTCNLHGFSPNVIVNYAGQQKAIEQNLKNNDLGTEQVKFIKPLKNNLENLRLAIVKIPKSMELFRLQLAQVAELMDQDGIVLCGFMTKYFTKQMLTIAGDYFESVEQSLAKKKSRVLILKKPKQVKKENIINSIDFEGLIFEQYFGVFSGKNIDYASRFLVRNWKIEKDAGRILDLASGNGFLAKMFRLQNPFAEIHLLDDDWLAVESSKLNFKEDENVFFHFNDSLEKFDDDVFDLIVCNPPFHFEFETNIEVAIDLFKQAERCLKRTGSFQMVSNRHLNYKTHLVQIFKQVDLIKRNKKFEIYRCS